MTISAALLLLVVQVLAALLLVATVVAGARKGATNRRLRRDAASAEAVRPVVVALVSGEPADWPAGALGRRAEAMAIEALRRVRGEARDEVVAALEARGVVDRALRRTR